MEPLEDEGKGQPAPFGKGVAGDLFIEIVVEDILGSREMAWT